MNHQFCTSRGTSLARLLSQTARHFCRKEPFWRLQAYKPLKKDNATPSGQKFENAIPNSASRFGFISKIPKASYFTSYSFFVLSSLLILAATTVTPVVADAATVKLAWDANSPAPDGYNIFMRTQDQNQFNYNNPTWSGTDTTCTIDGLTPNTYYFVARAFKGNDQSGDSNEVFYKVVINQPPVADAGADLAVTANTKVTMDGSASSDPEGDTVSYQWVQTSGPTVNLANAASATPTFTAPNVANLSTLNFDLTVSDAQGLKSNDTCKVTVLPVAALDSDNDGITDEDETNLYGTNPYSPDTDGDGITDGQEIYNGTDPTVSDATPGTEPEFAKIWIEAEDGDIFAPMEIVDNTEASSGSGIEVPNGNGMVTDPSNQAGYAEYSLNVSVPGAYVIWGRVLAPSNADNSFYISVDNSQEMVWHTKITSDGLWAWDPISVRQWDDPADNTNPMMVHLTAGSHTLRIKQREDGTQIDKILITNDLNYVPEGEGELYVPEYKKIWLEAEAGMMIAPMQIATDTDASAGSYITVPAGNGMVTDPSSRAGYAEYSLNISVPGDYVIWGRVLAPNNADNSFYISIDNSQEIVWHTKITSDGFWTWDPVSVRQPSDVADNTNPMMVHLTTGSHTLRIKQREDGTQIDTILITNDLSYVPDGLGEDSKQTVQKIWLEAEKGIVTSPMSIANDLNASAGSYIMVPDGTGKASTPSMQAGSVSYIFNVTTLTDYLVWGRVISNNNASDSVFVSMDGGEPLVWHTAMGGEEIWTWDVVSDRNFDDIRDASNPLFYRLEPGEHTLTIFHREDGTKIDSILITNDSDYTP